MNNKPIYILLLTLITVSCSYQEFDPKTWSLPPELELSSQAIELRWNELEFCIDVSTNYKEFRVSCSSEWCHVVPNLENKTIEAVIINKNLEKASRTCSVTVSIERGNSHLSKNITVVQRGGESEVINNLDVFWDGSVTKEKREVISNILSNMVFVKGGSFYMGAQSDDMNALNYIDYHYDYLLYDSKPVHHVILSDFHICKFEMTQKEWLSIMDDNPSLFKGSSLPVDGMSFDDAMILVSRLSEITSLSFSLPTEAQWEYAARGGSKSLGYLYPGSSILTDVCFADFRLAENSPYYTSYIGGMYQPNELGLYDMAGNISELCLDFYGTYSEKEERDPQGPSSGQIRVKRGGSFCSPEYECTVYSRYTVLGKYYGIRLVIN